MVLESYIVRWPDAEVNASASLVEQLIREQHPDLSIDGIRAMPPGFDNTIWRLGDDMVVRLPRREVAVALIRNEQRWLPELARRLPLAIPIPLRVGRPSEIFPWPWTIAPWIDGLPGNTVDPAIMGRAAAPLGRFLRALHCDAPDDAPSNQFRGVPLATHRDDFLARLDDVGDLVNRGQVLRVWEASLDAAPWTPPLQWIHGDPHPANLIFRDDALVGVIDFGDLCAGDPASDLAGALLALPAGSLNEFFRAYGDTDGATLRRTLGWAVHVGLMFILLGLSDEPSYEAIGHRAITNAIEFTNALT